MSSLGGKKSAGRQWQSLHQVNQKLSKVLISLFSWKLKLELIYPYLINWRFILIKCKVFLFLSNKSYVQLLTSQMIHKYSYLGKYHDNFVKIGPNFVGSLFLNFSKAVRIHFVLDQTVETIFWVPVMSCWFAQTNRRSHHKQNISGKSIISGLLKNNLTQRNKC